MLADAPSSLEPSQLPGCGFGKTDRAWWWTVNVTRKEKKNVQEKHNMPDSVQCGTNRSTEASQAENKRLSNLLSS